MGAADDALSNLVQGWRKVRRLLQRPGLPWPLRDGVGNDRGRARRRGDCGLTAHVGRRERPAYLHQVQGVRRTTKKNFDSNKEFSPKAIFIPSWVRDHVEYERSMIAARSD